MFSFKIAAAEFLWRFCSPASLVPAFRDEFVLPQEFGFRVPRALFLGQAPRFSPTTSPARTPSLASSSKIAWFRRPTDVFRSQRFRIRSTVAAGRNLGSVESDQLGTVGTQPARSVAIAPRCRR